MLTAPLVRSLTRAPNRTLVGRFNGAALNLNYTTRGALYGVETFTRASAAWAYNSAGVLTSHATDVPRFDYDPVTLAPKGLLIEEARTNLLLRSEEINNASWTKTNATVTADAAAAPTGALTADRLVENSATNVHDMAQSVSFTSGTQYVLTFYAKADTRDRIRVFMGSGAFGVTVTIRFNLAAGSLTVTTAGTNGSSSIVPVGNGWYRCMVSAQATATASANITLRLENGAGADSYTGDSASGLYIWGTQIEAGAFATSYILTTSATATRAVDICYTPTSAFPFNAAAGTLFAEFIPLGVTGLQTVVYLDDTTNNERMGIRSSAGTNAMLAVDGGATQVNASIGTVVAGTTYKSAMSYVLNDFAGCQNGGTVATDAVVTLPTVTRFLVGSRLSGSEVMSGHYKQVRYYPIDLDNTTLQRITS